MKLLLGLAIGAAVAGVAVKALQDPEVRTVINDLRSQLSQLAEQVAAQAADVANTAKDTTA